MTIFFGGISKGYRSIMNIRISNHWYDCKERVRKQMKKRYFGGPFEGLPGQISEFAPSRATYGGELYRREFLGNIN
jgi:hypothetical protein